VPGCAARPCDTKQGAGSQPEEVDMQTVKPSLFVAGALLVAVSSCFPLLHWQRYPKDWPAVEESGEESCDGLAGEYRDRGVSGGKKPRCQSLTTMLFGLGGDVTPTHVRFEQPDADTLEISAWEGGTEQKRARFSRSAGEMQCTSHGIRIRSLHTSTYEWQKWGKLIIAVDHDHALIVRHSERVFGAAAPVMMVGNESLWYRFLPFGPEESTLSCEEDQGDPP
jgi:hypothetical protein